MGRTRALMVTALLALVVLSGCQGGTDTATPTAETPSADQLRQQTISTMEDVETASFTMNMTVEAGENTIEMDANGRMDLAAERMYMEMDSSMAGRDVTATQYVDGDTVYIEVDGQWQTRTMPDRDIWENNQLAQQKDVLKGADVRVNGTTVVDGRDVYRLEVEANESVARDLLQQGAGSTAGSLENVDIESLSFTQYVDVETKHVRRIEMQMEMTVQGQATTADMTMTFSDFDEDVNIQIPDEATEA